MMKLYVSSEGNDGWSGVSPRPNAAAKDGPFATFTRARDAIRAFKAGSALPPGGVEVIVRGGEYALTSPLAFTGEDSGTADAPVVYRAADGETVRLSGGVKVGNWQRVTDPEVLAQLDPAARGHVWQTDLAAQGITDFGVMGTTENHAHSDPGLELFFDDQPMTLARYPNEGYMYIDEVVVKDGYNIRGTPGSRVGRFRYTQDEDRPRRWVGAPDPVLHGCWFWDWRDQRIAVASVHPDTREIVLDDAHPHPSGYRAGQWFYAFNLLCELDRPVEWYLDRDTGILYFWPPAVATASAAAHEAMADKSAGTTEEWADGEAVVSVLRDPVIINNASHLTLQGMTLEAVRGTAIQISGGEAVTVAGCTLRNIGRDAVHVDGGIGHRVVGCDIYHTGDGAITLTGGDRQTLTPGGHEAINNHIHHIARWNPLYQVGIQLNGVGNCARNNRLHHLPHIGINFTGNDQLIENNEIYHAVHHANDAGMVYTSPPFEEWSMRGHVIRHNFLHHARGFRNLGCSGVYLDDMFSSADIVGNCFWRVANPILLGGGRDNTVENNVFIDCESVLHIDARAVTWASSGVPQLKQLLEELPYREPPWSDRYPELVHILEDEPALPKGNVVVRNICQGGRWDRGISSIARPLVRMEDNVVDSDPGFVDAERHDFRLREDAPARKLGIRSIPFEHIGLQVDEHRVTIPPREVLNAILVVERQPLLHGGRCLKPGIVRLELANDGDIPVSSVYRLCSPAGRPLGDEQFAYELEPLQEHAFRFEARPDGMNTHVSVVREGEPATLIAVSLEAQQAAVTPWLTRARISEVQPGAGHLDGLTQLPDPRTLQWHERTFDTEKPGFCNLHDTLRHVGEADGLIYIAYRVHCPEAMSVGVLFGYDGPVRLFVDNVSVYHDAAGRNPARPDVVRPRIELAAGNHELVVALGANRGLAWGIFLRLQRLDVAEEAIAAGMCRLPQPLA